MTHCYLGLGSNLNSPRRQLNLALRALKNLPKTCVLKASSFYQTSPVGSIGQPMFCNAVVLLDTYLAPEQLLMYIQSIEHHQKRTRKKHWGPRTLDIDILLYGTQNIKNQHLTIPHPRIEERAFVLVPLLEIWPDASLPDGTSLKPSLQRIHKQAPHDIVVSL